MDDRQDYDENEQYCCNDKSMDMTSVAMVVSAASLHYVITNLLDLINAYDLVQ